MTPTKLQSPELILSQRNNFTQKCDVYSFGVILLEILTGRMAIVEEGEMDLVKWVLLQRMSREECCTWEVLDFELLAYKEMELETMALLQLALLCVAQSPRDRPKMSMVHRMIEDIRMKGGGEPEKLGQS
jgi:serine/threonine protein kinase